ncbi:MULTISPECIES: HAD family hydrolase [unclassified Gordonia (in: high G+C Gram-positive bacteria)]|uniref:HAD family hydrolase n=1 Tax=unclassified Gordonia (in: high G+C Gram-positive bacteria) TaxID=2657482 RepID=UPI001F10045E|nr:HAD-IA family hydrolase [Gordonia sp. ABSL49_1]MCH5642136.1 HAD-IA family hydrolase [Gordonia sp. ABSL49_1]
MSAPQAVLFDFSGTLFRFEARDDWFDGLHDEHGDPLHVDTQAELIRKMTQPVGVPDTITGDDRIAWENRDLDPAQHRRAYLAMLGQSGLTVPEHAVSLYERVLDPDSWVPFDDTVAVLQGLSAAGIPVGVVSNIAFDLRRVLRKYGVFELVSTYALSYEVGAIKPDSAIFEAALDAIGVEPKHALMVGDSDVADGGSVELGCAFALVHDVSPAQRPTALLDAVRAHGIEIG